MDRRMVDSDAALGHHLFQIAQTQQGEARMSPSQCREARERLNWSHDDLANASRVPAEIVAMFEAGDLVGMMDLQVKMRDALEAVGIGFPFIIERRGLVPAGVTYSPPDRRQGH